MKNENLCDDLLTILKIAMTLRFQKNIICVAGIGLAAPQVDVSKRIFALHITEIKGEPLSFIAINPKIVSHSVEKTYLSIW